ncbi:nitrous oxide reductase accessory protein NosL [Sulfurovum sp. CS9]|uniref:nitrous oxide reductase accessory protein NosL n=1 Tax=Sulfurovum sp. CS9 TaxID=3391146 RepID=UPI0039EC476E
MKKITFLVSIFAALLFVGCTDSSTATPKSSKARFQTVSAGQATLVQTGKDKESCVICGMNLPTFYKTSHAAETKAGTKRQYCSLHCVVEDNEINKTDLVNLKVVDTNSLKLISVYKAFYVVGSSKPGTMTRTSKYAFAKKSEAEAFAKEFGGKVMNFNDTYTVSMKDRF